MVELDIQLKVSKTENAEKGTKILYLWTQTGSLFTEAKCFHCFLFSFQIFLFSHENANILIKYFHNCLI